MSSINAGTTAPTALTLTGSTDGTLDLQTSGTTRMTIDGSGNVGIGGTADAASRFEILGTASVSSGSCRGVRVSYTIPSTATATSAMFASAASTQAASFTLANALHFVANGVTVGSGSSITNQYGFVAQDSMTGATNNIGFYSNIASASGRWNFYAAGTARNYFAGNIGVGADSAVVRIFARGANAANTDYVFYGENSAATLLFYVRNDGVFNTGVAANSPYNLTTANAANCFINSDGALYRSTSSLRYKTNVANAAHGLADVLKLRSVTYKAKNDGNKVFGGLIAEEVHDAGLTEFVAYDKDGQPDAIHYGNMVALLTKAIQEQQAMIDELKAKVAALEAK